MPENDEEKGLFAFEDPNLRAPTKEELKWATDYVLKKYAEVLKLLAER